MIIIYSISIQSKLKTLVIRAGRLDVQVGISILSWSQLNVHQEIINHITTDTSNWIVKWCQGSAIHIHIHGADWYFKFAIYPSDSYVYNETKIFIWNTYQINSRFELIIEIICFSKIQQNISILQKKTMIQRRRLNLCRRLHF